MKKIFLLLLALVTPLILLPIEKLLPYPHIIEELAKLGIVSLILKNEVADFSLRPRRHALKYATPILAGLFFALSESLFYLGNAFSGNYAFLFGQKLLLTSLLHVSTFLLFFVTLSKSKKLIFLSLPAAILLHFFFNQI